MNYSEIENIVTSAPKTVLTPVHIGVKGLGKLTGNLIANVVKVPVNLVQGVIEGVVEKNNTLIEKGE